ncbi:MAG TPA: PAS domain S-box protein [Gemmatimonadales bacterium]|nr:PAS domain S-box protein [Gemmatimonadales bacterium]
MDTRHSDDVAERQVEDVRLWLAAVVDSSDDAIISKNLDGVILTWNPAAQRLFGYSEEEAVGQPITIIIPPELRDEEEGILRRLRAGERIDHHETRRITRGGRYLDVSLTISPVRDAEGRMIGASKILRDVTESKRAERALWQRDQQLANEVVRARTLQAIITRLISESTQETLSAQILDAAIELLAADAASIQMLAPDEESLTLVGYRNFEPDQDSAAFWQRVTADASSTCGRALRDNERVLVTDIDACEYLTGTQEQQEYRRLGVRAVQSTPLRSRGGKRLGMLSTHWRTPHAPTENDFSLFDVLARQAANLIERVREGEERFQLIANSAPVTIWMTDADKQCTYVNQVWIDLTGRPFEEALGEGWADSIHPEDVERSWTTFANACDRREPFQIEYRVRRKDGECRWITDAGAPRYNADGVFVGYIGSAVDVTERKRADEAAATLSQRLIEAQESERSRLARELHDDINQRLALLNMRLDAVSRAVPDSAAEGKQRVEEARQDVMSLVTDVGALSHRLHPPRLEYLGIARAAAALCREISNQQSVEVRFDAESVPEGLSKPMALCLYRVLQEALQNAIKHSGSPKVDVSLRGGADHIELTIHDVGVGFDVDATRDRGLGLASMNERLKAVDGQLVIASQLQHGTTIRARVPLLQH